MLRFFWFEEGFHIAVVEVCEFFCSLFKLFWVVTVARALLCVQLIGSAVLLSGLFSSGFTTSNLIVFPFLLRVLLSLGCIYASAFLSGSEE